MTVCIFGTNKHLLNHDSIMKLQVISTLDRFVPERGHVKVCSYVALYPVRWNVVMSRCVLM